MKNNHKFATQEFQDAQELDTRKLPKKTYSPAAKLCVGHHLKIGKTKGGLLLPTGQPMQKQLETRRIIILAVGPDVKEVKVGDTVLVSDNAPAEVVVHRDEMTIVFPSDCIIGVEDHEETAVEQS